MGTKRSSYLVGHAFRRFLLASVLTASASQVGTLIDGLMLSRFINESAMSAINITSPVSQALFALCVLLGTGGSMLAGMAMGNHRRNEASGLFSMVVTVSVILGIVLGAMGMIFMGPLVSLLCPDIALQAYTTEYLEVIMPASPIFMLMTVMQMFVTIDGDPKRVTAAVTLSMVTNLVLDYAFIVWCGWAMIGAAVATAISYIVAILVLLPHFRKPDTLRYSLPRTSSGISRIAVMGLPFGIATVLIAVQMLGNNLVAIGYLGAAGIVTLSICMYMLRFSMIILTGTLESFQPIASILKGSGDHRGVALVLRHAYAFMAITLSVLALILILFPGWIGDLFDINDAGQMEVLCSALPAFAFNIIFQCAVYLLIPVYQIYSHKRLAFLISFGQPMLPMLCFWLLSSLTATYPWINPWWGFAIGQVLVVVAVFPFAIKDSKGVIPFVLIPNDSSDRLLDVSIQPDMRKMQNAVGEVDNWLHKANINDSTRLKVELACEETINNIIRHSEGNPSNRESIDLRVSITNGKIILIVRDEGRPFNPVEQDPGTGLGLMLVKKTCDELNYEYLLHQNVLTISWHDPTH
ncbi:MAG: ATP-binding protein [Muribaculaceae bacterium]|nr:ATP-binding protein [Muribaculaceae bacterium]